MEKLSFRLPVFEGPLDVLLFLISKNKLNIYDIPITELLRQYIEYLNILHEMDLDVASEFLEMASKLVQIKSSMLLPKYEGEDNDPRNELVTALIEYQTAKAMALALGGRCEGFNAFVREPQEVEHDETYHCKHKPDELLKAYFAVAGKARRRLPPPASAFQKIVAGHIVSVSSRVVHILKRLIREGRQGFSMMFEDSTGRSEAVATFLALLELIKNKRVVVEQDDNINVVKLSKGETQNGDKTD
jgi:segregation and condensation protein A